MNGDINNLQAFGVCIVREDKDGEFLEKVTAVTFASSPDEACRRVRRFWKDTAGHKLHALPMTSTLVARLLADDKQNPLTSDAAIAKFAVLEADAAVKIATRRRRRFESLRTAVVEKPRMPAAKVDAKVDAKVGKIDPFSVVKSRKAKPLSPTHVKPGVNDSSDETTVSSIKQRLTSLMAELNKLGASSVSSRTPRRGQGRPKKRKSA